MQLDRKALLSLLTIISVGMVLRFYHIDGESLWFDEGILFHAATQPSWTEIVRADPTNPPLYSLLLNGVIRCCGKSLFAMRWLSAMLGLVVIALSYQLGRRLFSPQAGLYASVLVALSPLLRWASQEIRMYILMAALVTILTIAWHRLLERPRRDVWPPLLGAELLLLYTHTSAPVIALWLNVATLLAWIVRGSLQRPLWRRWIAGQAVVALLWMPWFVNYFIDVREGNRTIITPPDPGVALMLQIWQAFWSDAWSMVGQAPLLEHLSLGLLAFAILIIPWRKRNARWLAGHLCLLIGGLVVALMILGNDLHSRYLVAFTPLLLVLIGSGIAHVEELSRRRLQERVASRIGPLIPLLVISPFLLVFATSLYLFEHNLQYHNEDVAGMVRYYKETLGPEDSVLAWTYADRYEFNYYWERFDPQARLITLPEHGTVDEVLSRFPHDGDVALNIWYVQRADIRGMLPCLLGHGTVNLPEKHSVYGMSNELYRNPALQLPALRPVDAPFEVAKVIEVGRFPSFTADRALCLPVKIRQTRELAVDLKVAVIAKNALGWEIARADARFSQANQRTTRFTPVGTTLTAYPLLRLPYGAPAGEYEIVLRIYDEKDPSGYNLLSPTGAPAGKEFSLGTWQVEPGADWTAVNRPTELPTQVGVPAGEGLRLLAHNVDPTKKLVVNNGSQLAISLLWEGNGSLPPLKLVAKDGSWEETVPPQQTKAPASRISLDWRALRVPPRAGAGTAQLRLPNGVELASYRVEPLPFLEASPEVGTEVGQTLPRVGELVGYRLEKQTAARDEGFPITLVWRAGEQPIEQSYTVFVQLLSADGHLIAQSDSIPARGGRPTTGWRPGEYIVDDHVLSFNEKASPGPATLIVGMYDPDSGVRLQFEQKVDALELPTTVDVR